MTEPRIDEFERFHELLTKHTPDDYTPWYFRVREGSKAPDTDYGSWKDESARLTADEAVAWMEQGGNVGIAGTEDDDLINVDIDDEDETTPEDLKPTLTARSRSRTGSHAWYFEAEGATIPNIPTDDAGEVRAEWQYVVAPGSYVETDPDDVPEDERDDAGYYTIEYERPVTSLRKPELPDVFIEALLSNEQEDKDADVDYEFPESRGGDDDSNDNKSALFDIGVEDIVRKEGGNTDTDERWSAIFHGSQTDANMSLSSRGLLQCWRHNVTHNAIQSLSVLSGYSGGCERVGSGHNGSNAGDSCIKREDGAHIWHAWKYAKQNGYIPDDDPVPYSALRHLCRERDLCAVSEIPDDYDDGSLPGHAYDAALSTIEEHDGLSHGRSKTDDIPSDESARSDGGAAVAQDTNTNTNTDTDTGTGLEDSRDWFLDPLNILQLAVDDPMHPADYDDDGNYDIYPRDLRTNERGNYVWSLAKKAGDDDILARRHGPLLAYKPETSTWENDDDQRIRAIAKESLGSAFSKGVVDEVEANIRADGERVKDPDDLGAPDETIMTPSGLLHLRDREIEPGKREHTAVCNLPHEPDWDADCPRWRDFIDESIETEAERQKFQEYCGYCLWRHAQTFGKAMLLVGPTDSGKSTALKVIRHVLGEDNVASESLQNLIDTRWGKAQLVGNIANVREEVTPSGLDSVEAFKELTGGEGSVTAEFKGQKKFDFVVTQKFMFATNEVPSVQDADEAFYNRLLFVRFPNTVDPEDQDPDLDDKLKAESPGILNWMLDGLDRLLDQKTFTGERPINGKKELCDAFGGVIDRFTHNCLMVTGSEDDIVSKSDLHDLAHRYADDIDKEPDWSKQSGFTSEISSQRGIGQTQRRINGDVTDVLTGVRVKPEVVYRYDMDIDALTGSTDGSDATGLQHYQDSEVRPGYDSTEERNVEPMVVKAIREHDDPHGMSHDVLVEQLGDDGVSEDKAERAIERCLNRGDIHEPTDGVYRST